jgi:hypothetical protein
MNFRTGRLPENGPETSAGSGFRQKRLIELNGPIKTIPNKTALEKIAEG